MLSNFEKVKEFHSNFDLTRSKIPTFPPDKTALLRVRLMTEELAEVVKAISLKNMPNIAKELADLLYVIYGAAYSYGIDIDAVFDEVHKSNMTKSSDKDLGGKIIKGDNYVEPNIEEVLRRQICK